MFDNDTVAPLQTDNIPLPAVAEDDDDDVLFSEVLDGSSAIRKHAKARHRWGKARSKMIHNVEKQSVFGLIQMAQRTTQSASPRSSGSSASGISTAGIVKSNDVKDRITLSECCRVETGLKIGYKIKPKMPILQVLSHRKLPLKFYSNGKLSTEGYQKYTEQLHVSGGGSSSSSGDSSNSSVNISGSNASGSNGYTLSRDREADILICLDRLHMIHVYDLSNNMVPANPSFSVTLNCDATQCIYMDRLGFYCVCAHDKQVRFYDPRWEYLSSVSVSYPITFMRYISGLNQLVVVGADTLSVLQLDTAIRLGHLTVKTAPVMVDLKPFQRPNSSPDEVGRWISDVYVQPRSHKLYLVADTELAVLHLDKQKVTTRITFPGKAAITCMLFNETLQWYLIGFNDGRSTFVRLDVD
jgi:hypothetical protein